MPVINIIPSAGGGGGLGPIIYEGENLTPAGGFSGAPATAKAALLARLTVSGTDSMESGHADFDTLNGATISANGVTGTITTDVNNIFTNSLTTGGLYATHGTFFALIGGDGFDPTTTIAFSTPVAAFWFEMTDAGDFLGQVTVKVNKTGGGSVTYNVTHTKDSGKSGTLVFWGIVDDTDTYDSMVLDVSNNDDTIGIDRWGMATHAQLV